MHKGMFEINEVNFNIRNEIKRKWEKYITIPNITAVLLTKNTKKAIMKL